MGACRILSDSPAQSARDLKGWEQDAKEGVTEKSNYQQGLKTVEEEVTTSQGGCRWVVEMAFASLVAVYRRDHLQLWKGAAWIEGAQESKYYRWDLIQHHVEAFRPMTGNRDRLSR